MAARKARGFLVCGARLTVVAPEVGAAMAGGPRGQPSGPGPPRATLLPARRGGRLRAGRLGHRRRGGRRPGESDALSAGALVNGADQPTGAPCTCPPSTGRGPSPSPCPPAAGARPWPPGCGHVSPTCPARTSPCWLRSWAKPATRWARTRRRRPPDWPDVIDRLVPLVEAGRIDEARGVLERLCSTLTRHGPPGAPAPGRRQVG